jgi:hypothetical protein
MEIVNCLKNKSQLSWTTYVEKNSTCMKTHICATRICRLLLRKEAATVYSENETKTLLICVPDA